MIAPPRLVGSVGRNNLVEWNGITWLVPQSLGAIQIDNPVHRARPGIRIFENDELARVVVAPGIMPKLDRAPGVRCTWWERTGTYSPFVNDISSPIFRRTETGEERSSRDLPPGALYAIKREPGDKWPPVGADGLSIACVLPDGRSWYIDTRASNCTMPNDNEHRCWVRHGTFGDKITVDKNGLTCKAGGGSIQTEGWHGHLRDGELRAC